MLPAEVLILLQFVLAGVGLFLFAHRIVSQPYRGFSILLVDLSDHTTRKLSFHRRAQLWFFLWWRQLIAGILAAILAAPLNVLLNLVGLRAVLGFNAGSWVSTLAAILAVGPILLKMLIGHQFPDFR